MPSPPQMCWISLGNCPSPTFRLPGLSEVPDSRRACGQAWPSRVPDSPHQHWLGKAEDPSSQPSLHSPCSRSAPMSPIRNVSGLVGELQGTGTLLPNLDLRGWESGDVRGHYQEPEKEAKRKRARSRERSNPATSSELGSSRASS